MHSQLLQGQKANPVLAGRTVQQDLVRFGQRKVEENSVVLSRPVAEVRHFAHSLEGVYAFFGLRSELLAVEFFVQILGGKRSPFQYINN